MTLPNYERIKKLNRLVNSLTTTGNLTELYECAACDPVLASEALSCALVHENNGSFCPYKISPVVIECAKDPSDPLHNTAIEAIIFYAKIYGSQQNHRDAITRIISGTHCNAHDVIKIMQSLIDQRNYSLISNLASSNPEFKHIFMCHTTLADMLKAHTPEEPTPPAASP